MKPIKTVFRVLAGLVLVILVLLAVALFYADGLIKAGVQTAGTQATGSETKLQQANLSLLSGSLKLSGLTLANPQGYQTPNLLSVGTCATKVDVGSLTKDTIVVDTIKLDALEMTIEQKGLTSNLKDLLDQMEKKSPKTKEPSGEKPKEEGGKKVRVNKIEITNTKVNLKLLPLPGQKDVMPIQIGTIEIENVGSDSNQPVMLATIVQKVLVALAEGAVKSGSGVLPADLTQGISSSVQGVQQVLGETAKQAESLLKDSGKTLEGAGENVKKGVGDLLKTPGKLFDSKKEENK